MSTSQAVSGVQGQGAPAQVQAGSLFGVPKYSTQPRFVPDNGNGSVALAPSGSSQTNAPTTKLDQLDIVRGVKAYLTLTGTYTEGVAPNVLSKSPFYPATTIQQLTFKLQAAYNTFNQTGPLASIIQAFRPMWGGKVGNTRDNFASPGSAVAPNLAGVATTQALAIDVPFAWAFDEYFDLTPQGDPARKIYDALVTPMFMAAQARVVVPTITLAPQLTTEDLLGGPVSKITADAVSTYTAPSGSAALYRDAFWTASNPAANPPSYPWLYTRDFFTQPTAGQGKVGALIQNTGVSVGQVLSLYGFVWDPALNSGMGGVVPMSSIASFELVTGGSLQNMFVHPAALTDKMRALYGSNIVGNMPDGTFVLDFMLDEEGGYYSNARAINTYLVNGVQLNITFNAGSIPSSSATVYIGVEALKLATS